MMRPTIEEIELTAPESISQNGIKISKFRIGCCIPIFLPFRSFHLIWNCILLVILLYSVVETPYTISFVQHPSLRGSAVSITLITDILFFIDVFINFRTAYVDKYDGLRYICDPKSIAVHYLKTWFTIDVISSVPVLVLFVLFCLYKDTDVYFQGGIYLTLTRLFRLLKLFRISKLLKTFQIMQRKTFSNETRTVLRLVKIFGFMLLIAHYCACVWYFVGYHTYSNNQYRRSWLDTMIDEQYPTPFDEIHNFTKYTYSIYWAIITLFTTGYGDIHACNSYEQWASLLCVLIGSLFFAYFIGVLTTSLHNNPKNRYEEEQVEEALVFCSHYNLPKQLREAVLAHIQYYCEYNYVFDENKIMNSLPNDLQKNVQSYLATSTLSGLKIFQSLSLAIIGQIAMKLKSKSVNTGHYLFEVGDIGKEIYIQRTGKSKVKYKGSNRNCAVLKRGDICGQDVIISQKRVHTVQCETWSEFYVLDIEDIMKVLHTNYHASTAKRKWTQIKNSVKSVMHKGINDGKEAQTQYFRKVNKDEYSHLIAPIETDEDNDNDNEIELSDRDDKKTSKYRRLFSKPTSVVRNTSVLNDNKKDDVLISLPDYGDMNERVSVVSEIYHDTPSINVSSIGLHQHNDVFDGIRGNNSSRVHNEMGERNKRGKSKQRYSSVLYTKNMNEKQIPLLEDKD